MENEIQELVASPQPELAPVTVWTDKKQFDQLLRAANMLSQTSIIPATYQGKPQDCFVALEMATRMGVSPLVVMQNMYVVKGKPAWAGQACTMFINSCGKFAQVKKCIDFRNWLKEVHGEVFEISAGEFKESGTSISTMAVVIKK